MLYHHCDGYPDAMLPKLATLLRRALHTLQKRGFQIDNEKLAAMVVAGSAKTDGIPAFCPCREQHGDIDYRYEVLMDKDGGTIAAKDRQGQEVGTVVIHREDGQWQIERHA